MAANTRVKTVESGDEVLKHKLFFGGNKQFPDDELKQALNEYGPVVDYVRHLARNCGYVTFFDLGVAQSLVGEILEMSTGAEVEMKLYTPQDTMREKDIEDIKAARAKYVKTTTLGTKSVAKKVAVGASGMKVPAAPKESVWSKPLVKNVSDVISNPSAFPPLGAASSSAAEPSQAVVKKVQAAAVPDKVQKAKKASAPVNPAPIAKPAPSSSVSLPVASGLVGGTKVEVSIREDDIPKLVLTNSKFSLTLLVCNGTNTSKTLEAVTVDGARYKNMVTLETSLTEGGKKNEKTTSKLIGPQQSFPVNFSVVSPAEPTALVLTFTFKLTNIKTLKHKVLLAVTDELPSMPIRQHPQYRPDHLKRRTVPLPPQFLDIRPIEHVPKFENEHSIYPLTAELVKRLEVAKMEPLTSPVWNDRSTYKSRMHDLLWMEEMEQLRLLRAFDLPRTLMTLQNPYDEASDPTLGGNKDSNNGASSSKKSKSANNSANNYANNAKYPSVFGGVRDALLAIEVPSLSERRPSIAAGDTLFAWVEGSTDVEYQGYIHSIRFGQAIVAFDPSFHRAVWTPNTFFTVRFSISRHLFLVEHLAVDDVDLDVVWPVNTPVPPSLLSKSLLSGTGAAVTASGISWANAASNSGNGSSATSSASSHLPRIDIPKSSLSDPKIGENDTQMKAIQQGMNRLHDGANFPFLIFGPFGTGKTNTLTELIYQVFRTHAKARILVCALSNSAADILATRLIKIDAIGNNPNNIFRLYASTRSADQHSLELQSYTYIDPNTRKFGVPPNLKQYRIVVSTCFNASSLKASATGHAVLNQGSAASNQTSVLSQGHFTHIFIDEAAQVMEADALIPLSLANKATSIVMAGDPKQLSYRSQSTAPALATLSLPIMERLLFLPDYLQPGTRSGLQRSNWISLRDNYRSHPALLDFASKQFYNGELVSKVDLSSLGPKLGNWEFINNPDFPMAFAPIEGVEQCEDDSPSFLNELEARTITLMVQSLLQTFESQGLRQEDIGIISPFYKQNNRIRAMLRAVRLGGVTVASIMNLQGREFKALFVSTVRTSVRHLVSDSIQGIGFINNPSALNTVVTRSRSALIVVGDPYTIAYDPHWSAYVNECQRNNTVLGNLLSPEEIAERKARDEQAIASEHQYVTSAADYRIDVGSLTYPEEAHEPEMAHDDPRHSHLISAAAYALDDHQPHNAYDANSYQPFASDHHPSSLVAALGNPILASSAGGAPQHGDSVPSNASRTPSHAGHTPSHHRSMEKNAVEYQPSTQRSFSHPSAAPSAAGHDGSVPPHASYLASMPLHTVLDMDKSPFLLASNTLPAPLLTISSTENNNMEVQIATVGFDAHVERVASSSLSLSNPVAQLPPNAMTITLTPTTHSMSTILWSNVQGPQQLTVIIPQFAQDFYCIRTPGWLKIILFRTSNITPPLVSDQYPSNRPHP